MGKIKEKLKQFWNETLGPDYPDVGEVLTAEGQNAELYNSMKQIEERFSTSSNKAGKGKGLKIDKAEVKPVEKENLTNKVKKSEDKEIGD